MSDHQKAFTTPNNWGIGHPRSDVIAALLGGLEAVVSDLCALVNSYGGAEGTRTPDPFHAMEVLYRLSYSPVRE